MKRGPCDDELTPPLRGDNMLSVVQMIAGVGLRTPLQFEDQAAAVHLGHFATRSVLGPYITGMLDGTGTEADPGISSLEMSNTVRNAAAPGHEANQGRWQGSSGSRGKPVDL
jgi:hypothetical protein